MQIVLGADHGGFELKEAAKRWLADWGYTVEDLGAEHLDPLDDYPVYAQKVVKRIQTAGGIGLLFCRSGGGMAIAANRCPEIRAVDCSTVECARRARNDNDANLLTLPADFIDQSTAKEVIRTFLTTAFSSQERHRRRIAMISKTWVKTRG